MPDTHRLVPDQPIQLQEASTKGKHFHDSREEAEIEFRKLRQELIQLQPALYAESRQKLLIVLQAMDAGGKDGLTRHMMKGVNPQGVKVTSFKKPSAEELAHDFLWRVYKALPPQGTIGVFNRSHYEDVLVVRVDNIVPEDVWRARYDAINHFEEHLTNSGTTVLKFFLHISKKEQKERFEDRLRQPDKHWKFERADLEKRKQWDQYQEAFQDMLNHCTTPHAPWHLIPADQKWYRNLAVMRVVVSTLRSMNPRYPLSDDLSDVVVE